MNLDKQFQEAFALVFPAELLEEIRLHGTFKTVPEGDILIDYGQTVREMPLLISGAVKVMREDEDGDDLLLYYLESGDTCAMTMNCCLGEKKSEVRAQAEKDCELVFIPVSKMNDWIVKYQAWRTFVLESYNSRMNELLRAIDSLAFMDMHGRVRKYLREKVLANQSEVLSTTHEDIARDLHSSRVVISRILKSLEKQGALRISRNKIEVLDF